MQNYLKEVVYFQIQYFNKEEQFFKFIISSNTNNLSIGYTLLVNTNFDVKKIFPKTLVPHIF